MKVAVISDTHLKADGQRASATGLPARFLDRVATFHQACSQIYAERPDLVVFGGDLFDTANPTPYQLMAAIDCFRELRDTPLAMIDGNHDLPRSAGAASALAPVAAALPNAVHIQQAQACSYGGVQLVALPYPRRQQLAACIPNYAELPASQVDEALSQTLGTILAGLVADLNPAEPAIMVGHVSLALAEVHGQVMMGREVALALYQVPAVNGPVVLGHIHQQQHFTKYGRPDVMYVGASDLADFGEEGRLPRWLLCNLETGHMEPRPIDCREYCTLVLDMTAGHTELEDSQVELARENIARVHIIRDAQQRPDLAGIRRQLEGVCWEFRGFTQEVGAQSLVRAEEVKTATTVNDLLKVWHTSRGTATAKLDLESLQQKAATLEV